MADEDVAIRVRLDRVRQFVADSKAASRSVEGIGRSARMSAASQKILNGALAQTSRVGNRALGAVGNQAKYAGLGLAGLGVAGVKWGLSFNAQVESANLRFQLFTKNAAEAQQVLRGVQQVDLNSAFNLGDLSDAAAMLGNAGVSADRLPEVLRATANAAAASGKGLPALQGIAIALSQIQAKGKLSQEEINQLNEAGAPGAQRAIQKAFGLTSKQVGNLGGQGLDATKAIDALMKTWTSGRMANAAKKQTETIGGQWDLLTGNMQKTAGAATAGLAKELERNVLPAANRASQQITEIFGRKGLSNEQKLREARAVINRELGPIADDAAKWIESMHLDQRLGDAISDAIPVLAGAATDAAPHVAKAFVEGWIHSGPWVQLASVLFAGKKAGDVTKWGRGVFGGGAGGAGGMLGRGATMANPLYVFDVSQTAPGKRVVDRVGKFGFGAVTTAGGFAAADAAVLAERARAAKQSGVNTHARPTGSFVNDTPANLALGFKILDAAGLDQFVPKRTPEVVVHVDPQATNIFLDGNRVAKATTMHRAKVKARRR